MRTRLGASAPEIGVYRMCGISELIGIRKPLQNRVVACGAEVFDQAPKNWIEEWICVHDIQVEWNKLAIQVELRLVIKRIAVVIL